MSRRRAHENAATDPFVFVRESCCDENKKGITQKPPRRDHIAMFFFKDALSEKITSYIGASAGVVIWVPSNYSKVPHSRKHSWVNFISTRCV